MEKVTNKEIADYLKKQVSTINGWTTRYPEMLELCKLGAFCKKNNLDIEKIKKLTELQEMIKGSK
jgi:hypothetical protein